MEKYFPRKFEISTRKFEAYFISFILDPRLKTSGLIKLGFNRQTEFNILQLLKEIFARYLLFLSFNLLIITNFLYRYQFHFERDNIENQAFIENVEINPTIHESSDESIFSEDEMETASEIEIYLNQSKLGKKVKFHFYYLYTYLFIY